MQNSEETLDSAYEEQAREMAKNRAEEELLMHPNALTPKQQLIDRYQIELKEQFVYEQKRQFNGAEQIVLTLQELAREKPDLFSEEIVEVLGRIGSLSEIISKDRAHYLEQVDQGLSLQEIAEVDDTAIDPLYQAAKQLYEAGRYQDAADAFAFLTGLNPKKATFWLGLGNAEYNINHYNEALSAYTVVLEATPNDPPCLLAISHCLAATGDNSNALQALDSCLASLDGSPEYSDWLPELEEEKQHLLAKMHTAREENSYE